MSWYDDEDEGPRYRRLDPAREAAREERDVPAVFRTREFKDLATEWDKILARDGFVDIERPESGYDALVEVAMHTRYRVNMESRTADLYTLMERWLGTHRWTSRRQRQWFFAASRGLNPTEIYRTHLNIPDGWGSVSRVKTAVRGAVDLMLEEYEAEPEEEVEA